MAAKKARSSKAKAKRVKSRKAKKEGFLVNGNRTTFIMALAALLLVIGLYMTGGGLTGFATLTVCAASCDATSVQAAINAANTGDTISIGTGTWTENVEVNKSVNLVGNGYDTIIRSTANTKTALNISAPNVNVSSLSVTCTGATSGTVFALGILVWKVPYANITNVNVTSCYNNINMRNAVNTTIDSSRIMGAKSEAVYLNNATNTTLMHSSILDSSSGAFFIAVCMVTGQSGCKDTVIQGNNFTNYGLSMMIGNGEFYLNNTVVKDNLFYANNPSDTAFISTSKTYFGTITNNTFNSTGLSYGTYFTNTYNYTVANNTFNGVSYYFMQAYGALQDSVIANNTFFRGAPMNWGSGVMYLSSSGTNLLVDNNVIANVSDDSAMVIYVKSDMSNVTITDNRLYNTTVSDYFIWANAENSTVKFNTMVGATTYGIRMTSNGGDVSNNTLNYTEYISGCQAMHDDGTNSSYRYNTITSALTPSAMSDCYGIHSWGGDGSDISYNSVSNFGTGIYYGGWEVSRVANNTINHTLVGIINDNYGSVIANNTIEDARTYALNITSDATGINITGNTFCKNALALHNTTKLSVATVDNNTFCVQPSSPGNATITSLDSFRFNVSNPLFYEGWTAGTTRTTSCQAYVDDAFVARNSSVFNNNESVIATTLPGAGPHTWYAYCNDSTGTNWGNSSVTFFTAGSSGLPNGDACTINGDCTSNHCVHLICRETDPYCTDTYCDAGETCDSCSADCGACYVDLKITNVWTAPYYQAGLLANVTANVSNTGTGNATAFNVSVSIGGTFTNYTSMSGLTSTNSTNVTLYWMPAVGSQSLNVTADYNNEVTESSETNNDNTSASITADPAPSDLKVTNIWTDGCFQSGVTAKITANVSNIGVGNATSFNVSLSVDGSYNNKTVVSSLDASTSTNATLYWTPTGGAYWLNVTVDYSGDQSESSNANNDNTSLSAYVDWPEFQHDKSNSGRTCVSGPDSGLMTYSKAEKFVFPDSGYTVNSKSQMAVAGDKLVVPVYWSGTSGYNGLYVLNASNVSQVFDNKTFNNTATWNQQPHTPVVFNDTVFVTSLFTVYAFNASNLNQQLSAYNVSGYTYLSSPIFYNGSIYVASSGYMGASGSRIYKLNPNNLASSPVSVAVVPSTFNITSTPVISDDGILYVGTHHPSINQGYLRAYYASNLTFIANSTNLGSIEMSSPIIYNNSVYVVATVSQTSSYIKLYRLELVGSSLLNTSQKKVGWSNGGSNLPGYLAAFNDTIYVNNNSILVGLDSANVANVKASTGEIGGGYYGSAPVIVGNVLYSYATSDYVGYICAYDPASLANMSCVASSYDNADRGFAVKNDTLYVSESNCAYDEYGSGLPCVRAYRTPKTMAATSALTGGQVDRDSMAGGVADSVDLTVQLDSAVPGVNLTFYIALKDPVIGGKNFTAGSAFTDSSGTATVTFNPDNTTYAGNYVWYANATDAAYRMTTVGNLTVMGSLNTTFTYSDRPGSSYDRGSGVIVDGQIRSYGPESQFDITSYYTTTFNATMADPSGSVYQVPLTEHSVLDNATGTVNSWSNSGANDYIDFADNLVPTPVAEGYFEVNPQWLNFTCNSTACPVYSGQTYYLYQSIESASCWEGYDCFSLTSFDGSNIVGGETFVLSVPENYYKNHNGTTTVPSEGREGMWSIRMNGGVSYFFVNNSETRTFTLGAMCGDGYCGTGETTATCSADCGEEGGYVPKTCSETCPPSTSWSSCVNVTAGTGVQTRTSYNCNSFTNYLCKAFEEAASCTKKCDCPPPDVWYDCFHGVQERKNFKCDEKTDWKCEEFQERVPCADSCGVKPVDVYTPCVDNKQNATLFYCNETSHLLWWNYTEPRGCVSVLPAAEIPQMLAKAFFKPETSFDWTLILIVLIVIISSIAYTYRQYRRQKAKHAKKPKHHKGRCKGTLNS